MRFIDKHIAVLAQANPTPPSFKETEVEGESPQSWFHAVKDLPHGIACEKLDIATNRYRLLAAANDGEKTTEELCVTILAWEECDWLIETAFLSEVLDHGST